jgi:hypothetical protein
MWNPFKKKEVFFTEEDGTAVWIEETGAIQKRVFKVIKRENGIATISFGNNERYSFNQNYIRKRRCLIYKTNKGIVVQNPDKWRDLDLKSFGIKTLRFNLQNVSIEESKSANHRWTLPEDLIKRLSPLFKILLISIAVGVIGWAAFKFAGVVLTDVLPSRTMDCANLLPKVPNPIGSETIGTIVKNVTKPLGV